MKAFFVTSSGTDIGKTFVTAGVIRTLLSQRRAARGLKPILSGFDPARVVESDTGVLLAAMKQDMNVKNINAVTPWHLTAPLAPDMAARREGKEIDFDALIEFSYSNLSDTDEVFIEGVGGVMVPLTQSKTVLDWMDALKLPTIVVVGSYLGAISHALTAVDTLRNRHLDIAIVIVSESEGSTVPLDETKDSIARFSYGIPCVTVPRARSAHAAAFKNIVKILDAHVPHGVNG